MNQYPNYNQLHCCACSQVCYHIGPASFCASHSNFLQNHNQLGGLNSNTFILEKLDQIINLLKELKNAK